MRLRNRKSSSITLQWEEKRKRKNFEFIFAHNKLTRHNIASASAAP
jgi:hypothetical protein